MEICVDGEQTHGTVPSMWRPLVKAICAQDARRVAKALHELPCDDYHGDTLLLGLAMPVELEDFCFVAFLFTNPQSVPVSKRYGAPSTIEHLYQAIGRAGNAHQRASDAPCGY